MAAKKKRLTRKEIEQNARVKKELQEKGIIPLDKPKLNRKKFIEEAQQEWDGREKDCFLWVLYLTRASAYVMAQTERDTRRVSLEAVGAAKMLKAALRLREFQKMVNDRGDKTYKMSEEYSYIKDILDA